MEIIEKREDAEGQKTVSADLVETKEEYNFWEDEINHVKKCSQVEGKNVTYFNRKQVFSFTFFYWTKTWIDVLSKTYLDPYKLHPLPESDQILYWQPIFSKYVSDTLIDLEKNEFEYSKTKKWRGRYKPKKLILLRAILYTFWKRIALATVGMVLINILSMSISMLLSKLLKLMSARHLNFGTILGLILLIIALELTKDISIDHVTFYIQRLIVMMDYSLGITLFHHGLSLRKNYTNQHSNQYKCGNYVHTCQVESKCTQNPFMCPAVRHKNVDITPKVYSYKFVDCYYVSLVFDCLTDFITFLTNFIYGTILIHVQMKARIATVFIVSTCLVLLMIALEVYNGYLLKFYYSLRDHRVSKSFEVITNFNLIKTATQEDLGENTITEVRNDELKLVVFRFFLSLVNKIFYTVCVTCALMIIIKDFVSQLKMTEDIDSIDASSIITLLFILFKIVDTMYMLPLTLKLFTLVLNSYNRIEYYIRTCSPNYYQLDKFLVDDNIKSRLRNLPLFKDRKLKLAENTDAEGRRASIPGGYVIKFERASFGWIFTREDLLYETNATYLENIDFALSRGEIAIVTGQQGAGKSNFIKAILGEMSLMSGTMFVQPLCKSMPIFYASQEVWIKRGSVRSNILFGLTFDQEIYQKVIAAMELQTDISNWERGDLRTTLESGFGLSGGQRVRVEFARAVYAYMLYSKVSKEYGRRGSFLMCLDAIFIGLDPFVGGNIFHNLFNNKSGLLVKSDLSVVMTISKRSLESCVSTFGAKDFGNIKIYKIKNKTLTLRNTLNAFITNINTPQLLPTSTVVKKELEEEEEGEEEVDIREIQVYKRCKSSDLEREGRKTVVKIQYDDRSEYGSHKMEGYKNIKTVVYGPFLLYVKAAGLSFFLFLFFLVVWKVLDNLRYIFASRLSNYVNDKIKTIGEAANEGSTSDSTHALIRDYSQKSFKLIGYLSIFVILTSVSVVVVMTAVSAISSVRIHEYSLDSSLYKSSEFVKIKRYLSDVITFLTCDTLYIDMTLGYYLFDTFVLIVESFIHMIMLMYLVPMSLGFVILATVVILRFPILWFVKALSNIRFAYMSSTNRINCVLNDTISGSLAHRSYRKESELVAEFVEHVDYNSRCRFMERATFTWCSVTCRCIFSVMTFLVILTPLIVSMFDIYHIKIGYYGLAFSLSINFTNRLSKLLRVYTRLQLYLCSVKRFENFIPSNETLQFKPKKNIHEEHILVRTAREEDEEGDKEYKESELKRNLLELKTVSGTRDWKEESKDLFNCTDVRKIRNKYVLRRKREYYELRRRCFPISSLFRPKINILDVNEYLGTRHRDVKLQEVTVLSSLTKSLQENPPALIEMEKKLEEEEQNKLNPKDNDTELENEEVKKRFILHAVNEEAKRSQIIGIIGRTGAGKTTLLSVLLNIAKIRRGSVLLDGVELNTLPKELIRQVIGVLPQLPFIFRGWTIRRFIDPRKLFSDEEIYEALEKCSLLDFVRSLGENPLDIVIVPDYYHKDFPMYLKRVYYPSVFNKTKDQSRGKANPNSSPSICTKDTGLILSNTQIRTLAFGRLMLYRNFYRMILIDEPPSDNCADDPETPTLGMSPRSSSILQHTTEENLMGMPIYRMISEYFTHCTTFIASHDPNALKSCSKIWVLSSGRIVMSVDKEQLLHDESVSKLIQECIDS